VQLTRELSLLLVHSDVWERNEVIVEVILESTLKVIGYIAIKPLVSAVLTLMKVEILHRAYMTLKKGKNSCDVGSK
jgi:hypothetical protein